MTLPPLSSPITYPHANSRQSDSVIQATPLPTPPAPSSHFHNPNTLLKLNPPTQNAKSLPQLPFLGKKTVPSRLRKDLWTPLCLATFPSPHTGLAAYRKLREFRRLHETAYPLSLITETEGSKAGSLLPTKKRGKVLMDQKANSVADLAAVLLQQEEGPSEERIARAERRMRRVEELKRMGAAKGKGKKSVDVGGVMRGVEGVRVRWADLRDAEFAATWPEAVVHESLGKQRHTAAFPVAVEEEEQAVAETAAPA